LSKLQKFDIKKEVMECVINRLKINYQVIGEGKPFLILHGWGSCSDKWQRVGELLEQKGLKVIIPDLPGLGKSEPPHHNKNVWCGGEEPKNAWNLDDYCDFVEEFTKALGLDKFYLLGHSFGGAVAVKFILKEPWKIEKTFLVAPAVIRKKTIRKEIIKKTAKIFSFLPVYVKKIIYRKIIKSDYPLEAGTMRETYLKIVRENLFNALSQIQVPTVIIWGEKDKTTPLKDAYFLREKIKNSKLEVIPDVDHNLHLESPEKLAQTIIQFIKS